MWTTGSMIPDWALRPWTAPVLNDLLSPAELRVLVEMALGHLDDERGIAYSQAGRRRPTQTTMRNLHRLGCVEFIDAKAGRWERGMWSARLTALGANAAARHEAGQVEGQLLDRHTGCDGFWRPDGTCTAGSHLRPLDNVAYHAMTAALPDEQAVVERRAPRLWCIEHGRLRSHHITTKKVCQLPGTHLHDGGLFRI